ncbi:MAG: hypothetical protein Q7J65_07170 [Candidatus Marinimicrobia bacterium]|nr:hypothetical protein [Candidatus Neomarinimicrobiota bacterium]
MSLQEILKKIVENNYPILLADSDKEWEADALLTTLSAPALKLSAHMQSGLYIAEVNEGGFLGRVLYRIKRK